MFLPYLNVALYIARTFSIGTSGCIECVGPNISPVGPRVEIRSLTSLVTSTLLPKGSVL